VPAPNYVQNAHADATSEIVGPLGVAVEVLCHFVHDLSAHKQLRNWHASGVHSRAFEEYQDFNHMHRYDVDTIFHLKSAVMLV
jgi:hypothetical protein